MTLNCLSISFNGRSTTKLTGYQKLQGGVSVNGTMWLIATFTQCICFRKLHRIRWNGNTLFR